MTIMMKITAIDRFQVVLYHMQPLPGTAQPAGSLKQGRVPEIDPRLSNLDEPVMVLPVDVTNRIGDLVVILESNLSGTAATVTVAATHDRLVFEPGASANTPTLDISEPGIARVSLVGGMKAAEFVQLLRAALTAEIFPPTREITIDGNSLVIAELSS